MDLPTYHLAYANFVSTKQQNDRTSSSISSATSSSSHRSSSSNKSASKSKKLDFIPVRSRVEFTKDQLKHLEAEYKKSAYLFKNRRFEIADDLGLTDKNVGIWFQNRRRKAKKEIIANGNKVVRPSTQNPQMEKFVKYLRSSTKKGQSSSKNVVLQKVANISHQKRQNALPVLKPLAAQFVKSTGRTVRKEFNPQVIVKVPLQLNQVLQTKLYAQQLITEEPEVIEEPSLNGLTPEEELQQFLHFKPKSIINQKPHQLPPPAQPQHVNTTQIVQILPKEVAEILKQQSEQLKQSHQLLKEQARQLQELKSLQVQHSSSATLISVPPQQQVKQTGYQQTAPLPVQEMPKVKPDQSDQQPKQLQQMHVAPKPGKQLQNYNNITQLQIENKKPLVQSSQQLCPHEIHLQNQQHAHHQQYCGKTDLNLVKSIPISDEAICDGVISLIQNTNSTTSEVYHKELQGIVSNFVDVLKEPTTNQMVAPTEVDMLSQEEILTFLDKFLDEITSNKDINSCENFMDFDYDNFMLDDFCAHPEKCPAIENPAEQQQNGFMDLSIDSNISFGFLDPNEKENPRTDDLMDILDICRETGIEIPPTPCEDSFLMEVLACTNAPPSSDSVSKMTFNELVDMDYQDQTTRNMSMTSVPALATPDSQVPVINISFEDYFKSPNNCTQPVITVTF